MVTLFPRLRSNRGKRVTIHEIAGLVHEAHLSSMFPRNILSGFRSTGNWPCNPDIFASADLATAVVTDNDFGPEQLSTPALSLQGIQNEEPGENNFSPEQVSTSAVPTSQLNVASSIELSSVSSEEGQAGMSSYVSPSSILPLPKAAPRKNTGRKSGRTRVFTDTPIRNKIAEKAKDRKAKKIKKSTDTQKAKKKLFPKKKKTIQRIEESLSSSDEMEILYDNESDCDVNEIIKANESNYVIVLVYGRSRALKYIARIDDVNDEEYKGVFLTKLNSIIIPGENAETPTFVINEDDGASFAPEDIILKLPAPIVVRGTARRSSQLRFDFDFKKIDLA